MVGTAGGTVVTADTHTHPRITRATLTIMGATPPVIISGRTTVTLIITRGSGTARGVGDTAGGMAATVGDTGAVGGGDATTAAGASAYWGGWGPGYLGTTGVGPSYYYSNTVTDPIFPPVTRTVTRNNMTEVIDPVTPVVVPPAPADPSQFGSLQSVDRSTTDAPVPGPAPSAAS